jgi:hypothetical protein
MWRSRRSGDRKDQAKQNHRPLHKVQGPVRFARTSTSAERSEARGGDVEQSAMYPVASPLVMARLTSRVDSQRSNCIVVGTRASSHYLLLCRGVVPHETTIDSAVDCSGSAPLRLRQSLIWAPPEGAAAAATANHEQQPSALRIHSEGHHQREPPQRRPLKSRALTPSA